MDSHHLLQAICFGIVAVSTGYLAVLTCIRWPLPIGSLVLSSLNMIGSTIHLIWWILDLYFSNSVYLCDVYYLSLMTYLITEGLLFMKRCTLFYDGLEDPYAKKMLRRFRFLYFVVVGCTSLYASVYFVRVLQSLSMYRRSEELCILSPGNPVANLLPFFIAISLLGVLYNGIKTYYGFRKSSADSKPVQIVPAPMKRMSTIGRLVGLGREASKSGLSGRGSLATGRASSFNFSIVKLMLVSFGSTLLNANLSVIGSRSGSQVVQLFGRAYNGFDVVISLVLSVIVFRRIVQNKWTRRATVNGRDER